MVPAFHALGAYIVCSAVHCAGLLTPKERISTITKPLLMPLLLIFYLLSAKDPNGFIIAALITGFLGDVFLMGTGVFFILGLLSFSTGHLCYISAFLLSIQYGALSGWILLSVLVFLLFGITIYRHLYQHIKNMRAIIIISYITILLTMGFCAFLLFVSAITIKTTGIFLGALLFITSDSLLACDLFIENKKWRKVTVMVTYTLAQGLLVTGFL